MPRGYMKLAAILCVLGVLLFGISYTNALKAAVSYMRIISIGDEESYQRVKEVVYPIASEEVRRLVFSKPRFTGPALPPLQYVINDVQGSVAGFGCYQFLITWTLNETNTIQSQLTVQHGVVIDAHRVGQ